jgi:hypothetical protein
MIMSELNHPLKQLDEMVARGRNPVDVWLAGSRPRAVVPRLWVGSYQIIYNI